MFREVELPEKLLQNQVPYAGKEVVREIRRLAQGMENLRVLHVNSTSYGGGVAELLYTIVPLMRDAGLEDVYKRQEILSEPEIVDLRGFKRGFPYGALIHNIMWIVIHLPLTVMLGLILAVILRDVKGGAVIKSIIFLGMVTPMVVGGIILRLSLIHI